MAGQKVLEVAVTSRHTETLKEMTGHCVGTCPYAQSYLVTKKFSPAKHTR